MQQRHKVQHISETISLYVPPEVSKALTGSDQEPENINQVTFSTCLSTDMQGFSTIAEHMRPAELAVFLNDYFETLSKPLSDHDIQRIYDTALKILENIGIGDPIPEILNYAVPGGAVLGDDNRLRFPRAWWKT